MALDKERQPGRPAVQPKEATHLRGAPHDPRTIIARLKKPADDPRSYQGYATFDGATGNVARYYVYIDQFDTAESQAQTSRATGGDNTTLNALQAQLDATTTDNTELRNINAELKARLALTEASADQLRAQLASAEADRARDREVIRILTATNALMAEAAETIQESAEGLQQAGQKALAGAAKYLKVTQLQRDALTQYITPDDLSDL